MRRSCFRRNAKKFPSLRLIHLNIKSLFKDHHFCFEMLLNSQIHLQFLSSSFVAVRCVPSLHCGRFQSRTSNFIAKQNYFLRNYSETINPSPTSSNSKDALINPNQFKTGNMGPQFERTAHSEKKLEFSRHFTFPPEYEEHAAKMKSQSAFKTLFYPYGIDFWSWKTHNWAILYVAAIILFLLFIIIADAEAAIKKQKNIKSKQPSVN